LSSLQLSEPTRSASEPKTPARALGLLAAILCVANVLTFCRGPVLWVGAVAGFSLAVGLPTWMLSQKVDWRTDSPSERLLYSVVSAILGLIVIGLAINTLLPHLGISRPLDRGPVQVTVDVWCGVLAFWRPGRFTPRIPRPRFDRLQGIDWTVALLSGLCVPLTILGANRLNNGAGDGLTLVMLCIAAITLTVMYARRDSLNPGTLTAAIYFISASMLLMTSLRGWYITGHDIQSEYSVFQLTKHNGSWNYGSSPNAYNACLSLTILPTMLWQLMRIDDPYIFKFWFQLLFALCPVFVYRISLRYTNRALAMVATIYFIAFPTFFTDMPFLNRQEIAYLFVAACIMMATDPNMSNKAQSVRVKIAVFSIGVVLSHYSTSYVFLGTVGIGWVVYRVMAALHRHSRAERDSRANGRSRSNREDGLQPSRRNAMVPAVSLLNVAALLIGILLWNGLATHTIGGLASILDQAIGSLRGGSDTGKSSDVSYSLFGGGGAATPAQALAQYTQSTLAQTGTAAKRAAAGFYSAATLSKYPLTIDSLTNLPTTSLGKLFGDVGVNAATLNSVMRASVARLLQLFVVIGLFSALRRARKRTFGWMAELIALASGALVIVALQVVLPAISADYGVLRAFQQAMIAFGPLIAVGSFTLFWLLPDKWRFRAVFAVAIIFFTSLVGIIPQALGGYPAQLNLNNSGQYYDLYYTHPQGIAAVQWLQSRISPSDTGVPQPQVLVDPYVYQELQTYTTLQMVNNDYPTLLQRDSYVFLGDQTVREGQASVFADGDDVTYNYPLKLLNSTDNLVYSSNDVKIYG
jgi:uncharacterized membrane protein